MEKKINVTDATAKWIAASQKLVELNASVEEAVNASSNPQSTKEILLRSYLTNEAAAMDKWISAQLADEIAASVK